jgi:hypothetical protein
MKKFTFLLFFIAFFNVVKSQNISDSLVTGTITAIDPPKVINFRQLEIQDSISRKKSISKTKLKYGIQQEKGIEVMPEQGRKNPRVLNYSLLKNNVEDTVQLNTLKYNPQRYYDTLSPSPLDTFPGVNYGDNGLSYPPDISISVNSTRIMEMTNASIGIFNKSGDRLNSLSPNSFFNPDSAKWQWIGDPRIEYDSHKDRWYTVSILRNKTSINPTDSAWYLSFMVSQTNDPAGNWYRHIVPASGSGSCLDSSDVPDFPRIGFNKKWVIIVTNPQTLPWQPTCTPASSQIFVFNKDSICDGYLSTFFTLRPLFSNLSNALPSITTDTTEESIYLVKRPQEQPSSYIMVQTMSGPVNNPTVNQNPKYIFLNSKYWWYYYDAKQKGTPFYITSGGLSVENVVLINKSLWFTHTAGFDFDGTKSGAQWYELKVPELTIRQIGRIIDDSSTFYIYPLICVNKNNDVLIVYGKTSENMYPSIGYSYRSSSDPINTMRSSVIYKQGTYFSELGRWGDYFGGSVDPVDSSFWICGETTTLKGGYSGWWKTTFAHVDRVDPCIQPTNLTSTNISSNSVELNWSSSENDSTYDLMYKQKGTSDWTTVNGLTTNSYTINNLLRYRDYRWQVRSTCPDGYSFYSTGVIRPNATCFDSYENNNIRLRSKIIATDIDIVGLINKRNDIDYFKIITSSPNTNLYIELTNLPNDYDLYLYNSNGTLLSSSTNNGTDSEYITYNTGNSGTYYIMVKGKTTLISNNTECYNLKANTNSTPY